jgi:hypothetical protein
VDLSGIIFVVLALVWAVYLIPKALRHGDEAARSRSIDGFSPTTRVIASREPVSRWDSRLVVPTTAGPPTGPPTVAPPATGRRSAASAGPVVRRTAARVAARRRRRILWLLLLCAALVGAAAYLAYVPRWSVGIPAGLTLVHLVLCRARGRRHGARGEVRRRSREVPVGEVAVAVPVGGKDAGDSGWSREVEVSLDSPLTGDSGPTEDRDAFPVAVLDEGVQPEARPEQEEHRDEVDAGRGGTLWDPLPVTLPTYVTKPKARRTVRTIDLREPGTWTSGRTAEDAEIAARATEVDPPEGGSTEGGRHAVGS